MLLFKLFNAYSVKAVGRGIETQLQVNRHFNLERIVASELKDPI